MNGFLGVRLSANRAKTPEGYLVCRSVPVSRTATVEPLLYSEQEIVGRGDPKKKMRVWRDASTLFHPASIASLEGKSLTLRHPAQFLRAEDTASAIRGHVQHVRPGNELLPNGEIPLLADLVIFDPQLISEIESGRSKEISLAYNCEYEQLPNGDWRQVQLSYNHCAVVPIGRGFAGRSERFRRRQEDE